MLLLIKLLIMCKKREEASELEREGISVIILLLILLIMIQYVMVKQYALNAFWLETINIELDSIISNHAWELVELHPKTKPIGCKKLF
jgi:hypothetical protein